MSWFVVILLGVGYIIFGALIGMVYEATSNDPDSDVTIVLTAFWPLVFVIYVIFEIGYTLWRLPGAFVRVIRRFIDVIQEKQR